jgi:hypothetical protein
MKYLDEFMCFYDKPRDFTIDIRGRKHIAVNKTTSAKLSGMYLSNGLGGTVTVHRILIGCTSNATLQKLLASVGY